MTGRRRSRGVWFVLCTVLAGMLVLAGCGIFGGGDDSEIPGDFSRVISIPMPGGVRVTSYHGSGSLEEAMDGFVRMAQQDGWGIHDDDVKGSNALSGIPIFEDVDIDSALSIVVLAREDQLHLLTVTRAGERVLVGVITGPIERVESFYEPVAGGVEEPGAGEVATDDPDDADDDPLTEEFAEFRSATELINTFSLLDYRVVGMHLRYKFIGVEAFEGEEVNRISVDIVGQAEIELLVDQEGNTVHALVDGEEPVHYGGLEHGDEMLDFMVTWLHTGVSGYTDIADEELFVTSEDFTEMQDFGPTRAEVRRVVIESSILNMTLELDFVALDDFTMMTRYVVQGEEAFSITEFELR